MRKFFLKVHLYIGAVAAVFLFLLGGTGAVLVFEDQIDHMLNKKLLDVQEGGTPLPLDELKSRIEATHPGYKAVLFELPEKGGRAYFAVLTTAGGGETKDLIVDPRDGRLIGNAAELNDWMSKVHGFHTHLSNIAGKNTREVLGWASLGLLVLSVTGLILWWPRKIISWSMTSSGKRMIFDLHNALGIYSSIFLVLFSVTGVLIHWEQKANEIANKFSPDANKPLAASKRAPGVEPLGPTELLNIAQAAIPGARVTTVQFVPGRPARVQMKFPEDHTPAGRSLVMIDQYSGQLLQVSPSRNASVAVRYVRMWNREIHTGDVWGWPTKILACFFSLMLCVMVVTGPLIWWNREGRQWFKRGPAMGVD